MKFLLRARGVVFGASAMGIPVVASLLAIPSTSQLSVASVSNSFNDFSTKFLKFVTEKSEKFTEDTERRQLIEKNSKYSPAHVWILKLKTLIIASICV